MNTWLRSAVGVMFVSLALVFTGCDGGGGGNATLRVVNSSSIGVVVYVDQVVVGTVPAGNTQDFEVSAGTHTVQFVDTSTLADTMDYTEGSGWQYTVTVSGSQITWDGVRL